MRAELREALSALADGEPADPQLVAEALLEPGAAALIVTLAEARATLRDTLSEPGVGFSTRVERALAADGRSGRLVIRRFTPALYAGLGLAAGLLVGMVMPPAVSQAPPTIVTRAIAPTVVGAPRLPVPMLSSITPPAPGARKAPPHPKSVYRFEAGRNWREGSRP